MMLELNLAIIGLILSILFSSTEIALISANKLQIDVWIKQNYRFSLIAKKILANKTKYIIVSLIGTNLSNIICSSFATVYLINENIISAKFAFIPIALIILLIGEILPKTIIREYANIMLLILSPIIEIFYIIFFPIVALLNKFNLTNNTIYLQRVATDKEKNREEFQNLYEQVNDEASIDENEKEIISNTIKKIIGNLNDGERKKILIMIPNNAKNHLKI